MNITLTSKQLHQIIKEEIQKELTNNEESVEKAAKEIVDEFENLLGESDGESVFKRIFDKIFKKSQEEGLDTKELGEETWNQFKRRERTKKIFVGVTLAAFLGGLSAHIDMNKSIAAQEKSAKQTTQQSIKHIEQQSAEHAVERLGELLSTSVLYQWSLNPEDQPDTYGDLIKSMEDPKKSSPENFPIFQDYDWGRVQILSQDYGVVVKVKSDIEKQIKQGVIKKADLKPLIDLNSVRPPDISVEEYAKQYKQLYNIPDFAPSRGSDREAIGGHVEQVRIASSDQIKFMKYQRADLAAFESYELLDLVNPELPNNRGMSPSQFYIKVFNDVTGQNIQP